MARAGRSEAWLAEELARRRGWERGGVVRQPDGTVAAGELPPIEFNGLQAEVTYKPRKPLESDVLSAVRDALSLHPAVDRVFRVNSGAHVAGQGESRRFIRYHDIPGMSDLWVWLKARHGTRQAFIEVKRPGEKPSDKQRAFLKAVKLRGHIAFVTSDAREAWNQLTEAVSAGGA